jgi:hypothetical protein
MKYIVFLLLISSCSLFRSGPELSESAKESPDWIYAPYEACSNVAELCATGESKTYSGASSEARKNLASIFEVQVKSEFSAITSSNQSLPWLGQVKQEVHQSLEESVNQVLEAVEIKKSARQKGLYYALASLNREKASDLIGGRIKKLDDELSTLWKRKSRTNLRKIIRLYLEREKLNERYSIVSETMISSPVTYKEIMEWRETRPVSEPLALRVGQAPEWITDKLKELLTEAGFKIVKGDTTKALSVNMESIREYLNVQGFEKYTFTLNITSFVKGEKNKVLSVTETVTGRTQADALLKVKSFFNNYIEQHLSDLHLD